MTSPVHLIVGPDRHGVVRHARAVAEVCGDDIVRCEHAAAAVELDWSGRDVVHVAFTDNVFGPTCEAALEAFRRVAARIAAAGASLSVTLHDVPCGTDALAVRRRVAYGSVIRLARGVVVNSTVELAAVQGEADSVHSLRRIELPVDTVPWTRREPIGRDVVVLGFVFPDRGYEHVLSELPGGTGLVALGQAAAGHERLPLRLAALAAEVGRDWRITGFVADDLLSGALAAAAVPIAPNARTTASASIATWWAHGRRPLVPDIAYTRDLLERRPGTLQVYDPQEPGALKAAIAAALDDPCRTWLTEAVGPSLADTGQEYRAHLAACASPAPIRLADGRWTVPGNRWDLLPSLPVAPDVSVVVTYYEAQRQLDLVLTALRLQTLSAERFEVVVADDGSAQPPDLTAAGALRVRCVRRPDEGFTAAAARNLGAAAAKGDVLVFLDCDTVPEPAYLEQITRLPGAHPDVMCVGRRRHAVLATLPPPDVADWFGGRARAPIELPEPEWLRGAYARSRDLRDADVRSYRYMISAVLCLHRELFDRIQGFDERFVGYGGEDWELAHRAWQAGALFVHVAGAIAWHDGPSWAQRTDIEHRTVKNAELLTLSRLLPDPMLRGRGQWLPYPRTVVLMSGDDAAEVLMTARSAFAAAADCGLWLTGAHGATTAALFDDPRIRPGAPHADVLSRAVAIVEVTRVADLAGLDEFADLVSRLGRVVTPAVVGRSTRALARTGGVTELADLLFGRHDRTSPSPLLDIALEAELPVSGQPVRHS